MREMEAESELERGGGKIKTEMIERMREREWKKTNKLALSQ